MASQFIRLHSSYFVSINLHDADETTVFRVRIEGADNSTFRTMVQTVTLAPYSSRTIHFETGTMEPVRPKYRLVVSAESRECDEYFQDETFVWLIEKTASIHVQTDRSVYRLGDTVRFRVVLLDVDLKPVSVRQELGIRLQVGD